MGTEEYRTLWKEAVCLCEEEPNKDEAISFVMHYYDRRQLFDSMDDRSLLLTFIGLVVYEKKFHIKFDSTTPASFCYKELLNRVNRFDRDLVYDIGDWAAGRNNILRTGNTFQKIIANIAEQSD